MHPRHPHHLITNMCLVLFFASATTSIFLPSVVASSLFPFAVSVPRWCGCFYPVDVRHPKWTQLTKFSISEYNKNQSPSRRSVTQNSHLVFQHLVEAESQVVAGHNHKLLIRAVNESLPADSPPLIYEDYCLQVFLAEY
ncbi:hypothetical protein ACFX19_005043 [Malus domestica]